MSCPGRKKHRFLLHIISKINWEKKMKDPNVKSKWLKHLGKKIETILNDFQEGTDPLSKDRKKCKP